MILKGQSLKGNGLKELRECRAKELEPVGKLWRRVRGKMTFMRDEERQGRWKLC